MIFCTILKPQNYPNVKILQLYIFIETPSACVVSRGTGMRVGRGVRIIIKYKS